MDHEQGAPRSQADAELEREILGFGEGMKVLAPRDLATRLSKRLGKAKEQYSES